jgi:hypothetical protein
MDQFRPIFFEFGYPQTNVSFRHEGLQTITALSGTHLLASRGEMNDSTRLYALADRKAVHNSVQTMVQKMQSDLDSANGMHEEQERNREDVRDHVFAVAEYD